jgi:C-terminal processing protease CtpA/Prc
MDDDATHIDEGTQEDIIHNLSKKLRECYIHPDKAEQIGNHLSDRLSRGEYKQLNEGNLFALALTMDMQEIVPDEHLWVKWHAEALPDHEDQLRLNPAWQQERQLEARLENYGFYKVERRPGNVGYLDIHYFHRPAWGGDSAASAMSFLANTEALIIDLRKCIGGYTGMVALVCSYLMGDDPVHLTSIYWRDEDVTQQYWTLPYVPGMRFVDKPVYVLTSKVTFSGGELFAHFLQSRKRATIIGEKTDGGANAGASYTIHPHFEAFIPIGRTIDPLTGSSWEGSGIIPDIAVSREQSFNTAYKLALQSVIEKHGKETSEAFHKLVIEAQVVLKSLGDL